MRISDKDHTEEELNFVKKVLEDNHYSTKVIQSRIDYLKTKTPGHIPLYESWISLPFLGCLSKRLSKLLRNNLNVNIGYTTGTKLSSLFFNFKDKRLLQNSGIYKLQCKNCPKIYIGESGRDINTRLEEHLSSIRNNNINSSAVAKHIAENPGHRIDKASFKLIERETRYHFRRYKESLYIMKAPNVMNVNAGNKINSILSSVILPHVKMP